MAKRAAKREAPNKPTDHTVILSAGTISMPLIDWWGRRPVFHDVGGT